MGTIVGWRGVCVELSGSDEHVDAVMAQLPRFFDVADRPDEPPPSASAAGTASAVGTASAAGTASAVGTASVSVSVSGGVLSLDAPDGLSCSGPVGLEGARAAASRIELLIADRLTDVAAVHAGAVALGGRVVLLPGTSMAGKSTLVRSLVERGAQYLSDEFALLDPSGRVWSYPRRMTIRTSEGSTRIEPTPARGVEEGPLPVAVVALLTHQSGHGWSVEPASAADGVLGLIANAVSARRNPERCLAACTAAVEGARVVRGSRGEADVAAAEIESMLT